VVHEDVTTTIAQAGSSGTARTGDFMPEQAFNAFVEARSTPLLRTAYLLTRDQGLAEDLLQTALAKAWFAWGRIEGQPEAYVRRIIVNTYATWWRRRWNGEESTGELPESRERRPSSQVEDRADLWVALGRLPRRQRAVVVLRFYEDLSEAQTAELLQCSVGTVKSQTSKALAKLRLDSRLAGSRTTLDPKEGVR
jgi:RNA polymerase sigma-70 factor (sigma-E family)